MSSDIGNWSRSYLSLGTIVRASVVGLSLLLMASSLFPQANQGTIQGSVYDQSGAVIVGASVTVIDIARGIAKPLTTDSAGAYVASNLTPGTYTVRGQANGFQTLERTNVIVEVGQTIRVDLVLQPGTQTQSVTITSAAPEIDTTDATIGGEITQQNVSELPINSQNFKDLMSLRPGIISITGEKFDGAANGTRMEDIGYLVDGVRSDERYQGQSIVNASSSGGQSTGLPLDSIQEFNNEENPKAEFGWKPGAIVNVGLKSGTNDLHGTAFIFGRDTAFDARNYFDGLPQPKQPITFEQFGGSAGGRIIKDKLFWFAAYEGERFNVGNISPITLPATVSLATAANPAGNVKTSIVDACNALIKSGATISPLSAQLIGLHSLPSCSVSPQSYTPGPNESMYPSIAGYTGTPEQTYLDLVSTNSQNDGIGKIDYHPNDHNTINGMYSDAVFYGVTNSGGLGLPGSSDSPFAAVYPEKTIMVYGAWNWTPSSTRVNELRAGYNRYSQSNLNADDNVNPLAYGVNTGVTNPLFFGMPSISIGGCGCAGFGSTQKKVIGPDGSLQLLDHYTIVHGNHNFKFGGEFIADLDSIFVSGDPKGTAKFNSMENFLEGIVATPTSTGGVIQVGNPLRSLNDEEYALFAQDDWRVTRNVMLNLGLRWEYNTVEKESNDLIGNFSPTAGLEQVGKQISSPYGGDFRNFSPRVGVAWDIRGNGRTVLRGGGSLMYSYMPLTTLVSIAGGGAGSGITYVPTGATIFDAACPEPTGCPGSGTISIATQNLTGAALTTGWQAQTAACVTAAESGGTVTCPTIFPTSSLSVQCGDGLGADPASCVVVGVNPNLSTPWVATWTIGVQQAISSDLSLDVSYVGTHGGNLMGVLDLNQPTLGSGFTAVQIAKGDPSVASQAAEQLARPYYSGFPYLNNIDELSNGYLSNFNSLQGTLTERTSHGLSFLAGYTFSHTLDYASSYNYIRVPINSLTPALQYGTSDFDVRNRFTLTATYDLPGKKSPAQLLEGWRINSIVTLNGSFPWSGIDKTNDFSGTGEVSNSGTYGGYWNFSGNPSDFSELHTDIPCWSGSSSVALSGCTLTSEPAACIAAASAISANTLAALNSVGCYVRGNSVMFPPALGTYGNETRNMFRGPLYTNLDLSVTKDWKIKERFDVQLRGEAFNVLNHPNFTNPGGTLGGGPGFNNVAGGQASNFGCGCETPDQAAPNPVVGSGASRAMQLGLKLIF